MNISNLMADPAAGLAYTTISPNADPVKLADQYLREKLAGNTSACTAIECHLRDMAVVHFNSARVLQGLQDMERHKRRRRMGKGAPKMLTDVASQLRAMYAGNDYDVLDDGRIIFYITVTRKFAGNPGLLKITCKDLPGAVELVACKYERGLPRR